MAKSCCYTQSAVNVRDVGTTAVLPAPASRQTRNPMIPLYVLHPLFALKSRLLSRGLFAYLGYVPSLDFREGQHRESCLFWPLYVAKVQRVNRHDNLAKNTFRPRKRNTLRVPDPFPHIN